MSAILSGAGGASCQLCTAHHTQLKHLDLIGVVSKLIVLFMMQIIFSMMSILKNLGNWIQKSRYGLTHPPVSEKDILAVSPLHSYLCVFRWLMLVIYHLGAGTTKWSPSSSQVQTSMNRMRNLLLKETSYHIDLPSCGEGTSSTVNVARDCFNNKRNFLRWATSTVAPEEKEKLKIIHTNLGAILRVFNSSHKLI